MGLLREKQTLERESDCVQREDIRFAYSACSSHQITVLIDVSVPTGKASAELSQTNNHLAVNQFGNKTTHTLYWLAKSTGLKERQADVKGLGGFRLLIILSFSFVLLHLFHGWIFLSTTHLVLFFS